MTTSHLTSHLGLYVEEDFLDQAACKMLVAAMRAGGHDEAQVYDKNWNELVNQKQRRTRRARVSSDVSDRVIAKLLERVPVFEQRFGVKVSECQGCTFLIYRPGDFFEPHQDSSPRLDAPEGVKQRLVSVIVFLNDEQGVESGEGFTGGSLAFYGLLKDPRCQYIGIPIKAKTGLMVAFKSDVFHQVTPVIEGERLSIVSWFL